MFYPINFRNYYKQDIKNIKYIIQYYFIESNYFNKLNIILMSNVLT